MISVNHEQDQYVLVREAGESSFHILLLHGQAFSSAIQETATVQWLTKLIRVLRLSNFVIVSPSMSGRFALPYVIQSNTRRKSIRSFIPIAPVGTKKI